MTEPTVPESRLAARARGRGASSNATGRYERHARVPADDGWDLPEDLPPLRTEVSEERVGRILTRNASPDLSFDRSVNPYRGCEHGCTYCFARPSHAYLGLSPGLDFETKLTVKPGAAEALRRELSAKGYTPATIAIGTNTDPYQPLEREARIMRACLEVLSEFRHPVGVVTKGALVARDADILGEMGQAGLARVGVSLTTLDGALARSMEPRVPAPAHRLRAIERLAVAGLFRDWIEAARPDRAARVMARVREVHGGRDYDPSFGLRQTGQGEYARLIRQRFRLAAARLGLATRLPPLRTDLFAVPPRPGDQLSLL